MNGFLLDTHVFVEFIYQPPKTPLRRRLLNVEERLWVSPVTAFEIAVKHSLGKLRLPRAFSDDFTAAFETVMTRLVADLLDIKIGHAARVRHLPFHHRDPFDRLLIAQAMEENLTLLSRDRHFAAYEGLKVLPA